MKRIITSKKFKIIILIIFMLYLITLFKVVFFRYPIHEILMLIKGDNSRIAVSINFLPFSTILKYISGKSTFYVAIKNLLGNILIFFPFGVLLPIIFLKVNSYKKIIFSSVLFSFFIEIIQIFLRLGSFDIDDIILNTIGASLGYLGVRYFFAFFNKDLDNSRLKKF